MRAALLGTHDLEWSHVGRPRGRWIADQKASIMSSRMRSIHSRLKADRMTVMPSR
jgi:hypothetical protein